jgi:hypothetical protein
VIAASGLASSDCERLGAGALAQPVNTWSSLAFLVAGAWILVLASRARERRAELVVFGVAVASNAIGGLLFHGVQTVGAKWVHDTCIVSVLLFIVVFDVARVFDRPTRWTMGVFAGALVALGLLLEVAPGATNALFGVLGVAAGGFELLEYRHEVPALRREGLTARRLARLSVVAVLAIAATAFFVGRTGGAFCNAASAFQWHAVWHVLSAAAMALYAYGAIEPHPAPVDA